MLLDEEGNERLMDLVDYQYNKKYKQLLHQYEYTPKYPSAVDEKKKARQAKAKGEKPPEKSDPNEPKKAYIMVNLNDYFTKTDEMNQRLAFLQFVAYQAKSQTYFVVLDSYDRFTVLNRDLSFRSMVKSHSEQDEEPQITSITR